MQKKIGGATCHFEAKDAVPVPSKCYQDLHRQDVVVVL